MSINFEKGKVSLNNSETLTVNLTKSYIKPVIKLTPSEDILLKLILAFKSVQIFIT